MRRSVVIASVTSVAVACALFPDLSGLSDGGTADATAQDAAKESSGDSGGVDGAPVEAGDASDGATSDGGGFCATHTGHTFCEDFDELGFQGRWNGVVVTNGGAAIESDASFVSSPNQLLTTVPVPANTAVAAYAYKHFATASTFKIQVALLVDGSTTSNFDPLEISFTPPPAGYKTYQIHLDTATQHVGYTTTPTDGGSAMTFDDPFTPSLATWRNIEIDLDLTTAALTITVDGTPTVNWTIAPLSPTSFDLRVGIVIAVNNGATVPTTVHVDNVLVDTN